MRKMKESDNLYYVFPSVVLAETESTVHILPRGEHARLDNRFKYLSWGEVAPKTYFPDEWFTPNREAVVHVTVVPMQTWYVPHDTSGCDAFDLPVDEDGGITLTYTFRDEQEYLLKVSSPVDHNRVIVTLSVYSVKADLYGKRPYKCDFHVHSIYSDGCEGLLENAVNYRAAAYDIFALTDHFKRFPSLQLGEKVNDMGFGITVWPGEEVHVPDIRFHYVHIGGDYSVNERFADNHEQYEREYREIYDALPLPDGDYKDFIARVTWIDRANRAAGGLSIFAHPHWKWASQNMPDAVTNYVFEHGLMEAFELMGGQSVRENNTQLALWTQYAIAGKRYPVVSSSDSHQSDYETLFNQLYTIVFAGDDSFDSIKAAILNHENVACEMVSDFRAYGDLRYVNYVQFLWNRFYPQYEELCHAVGEQMKQYYQGYEPALQAARNAQARAAWFVGAFFGKQ